MTTSEKWPKAPLIFVLGAVKISQYPNLHKRISDLHEAVLDRLPKRHNAQGTVVKYNLSSPSTAPLEVESKPITRLYDPEDGVSLFLRDDLIAFEITQYSGYEWFKEVIRPLLEAIIHALPNIRPELVGLRYLDAILDKTNEHESVETFVRNQLLGVTLPTCSLASMQVSQQFRIGDKQTLTISFLRGEKIAETLLPGGIEIPSFLATDTKLRQFSEHVGGFGLLDFDSGIKYEGAADLTQLMSAFGTLHATLREALPLTATPEAMNYWKGLTP